jgi:hypothetical protein
MIPSSKPGLINWAFIEAASPKTASVRVKFFMQLIFCYVTKIAKEGKGQMPKVEA